MVAKPTQDNAPVLLTRSMPEFYPLAPAPKCYLVNSELSGLVSFALAFSRNPHTICRASTEIRIDGSKCFYKSLQSTWQTTCHRTLWRPEAPVSPKRPGQIHKELVHNRPDVTARLGNPRLWAGKVSLPMRAGRAALWSESFFLFLFNQACTKAPSDLVWLGDAGPSQDSLPQCLTSFSPEDL